MAQSIKMPALGESVTEGTVTAWLKQVGDTVEVDEPIVEVATDKVDSEVPSPVAGVLLEILVQEDDTVEVGTEIARVGDVAELGGTAEASPTPQVAEPQPVETPAVNEPAVSAGEGTEVKMPALGESVTEGTVTAWLKQVGDMVEADEPLVEVATDKVDSEVPAPVSGYLTEIRAQEDETVSVGSVIAIIGAAQGTAVPTAPAVPVTTPVAPPAPPTPPAFVAPPAPGSIPAPPAPTGPAPTWANAPKTMPTPDDAQATLDALATKTAALGKIVTPADADTVQRPSLPLSSGYVTPLVRKLARELGIDLTTIAGSGVGGRIRKEDVIASSQAVEEAPAVATAASVATAVEPDPLRGTTEKMSRLRQTIARRMVESLQTAAQLTTVIEVDVTKVAALRAKHKDAFQEAHGTKLTFLPFFVRAATEALLTHPKINAQISDNQVTYFDYENVGIAVDAPRGLMVPVIKQAGEMNLARLADSINTLAQKTREGTVSPDDLTGSTFTITNTGSGGALFDTPVLNMPEVAILGVGAIVRRPVVVRDQDGIESISIHSMVYLSLSYDHRLVDGADAARYLQTVKKRLEAAEFEADLGL